MSNWNGYLRRPTKEKSALCFFVILNFSIANKKGQVAGNLNFAVWPTSPVRHAITWTTSLTSLHKNFNLTLSTLQYRKISIIILAYKRLVTFPQSNECRPTLWCMYSYALYLTSRKLDCNKNNQNPSAMIECPSKNIVFPCKK